MKRKKKKLPKFLQSALWSYDLGSFDLANPNDRNIIVTQILNHGTDEQVKWLFKTFTEQEIKSALSDLGRGDWYPQSLSYWLNFFKINLNKNLYERAIKNLYPEA